MVEEAQGALAEADLVLMLVEFEPSLEIGPGDRFLLEQVQEGRVPFLLVLNKIDLGRREDIEVLGLKWRDLMGGKPVYPTAATLGVGVRELFGDLKDLLPPGPPYFDEELLTDRSERFVVGELIREKVFELTRQEVPYSTAVLVEEMKERPGNNKLFVKAVVFVETDSQKKILIGKGGAMLKKIGRLAREDIEQLLNCGVYLDLWVKVLPHWRRDRKFIQKLEQPHL